MRKSDDTISRADAIEQIQTWAVNLINPKMLSREDAIYILESMPSAQPEQQWIPCSERLPEEKGEYIVAYHPCYWDDVEAEVKVGVDSFRGKTSWAKQKYQRVIAWMPLPPVYQEEDSK